MRNSFAFVCLILCCFFLAISLWSAHAVFVLADPSSYAENGPLEALQAILLALACLVFLVPVALREEPARLIPLFLSVLCYSFVVRELDVERLNVPETIKFFGSGIGRNATLAVAFGALLVYAGFHFSYYKKASVQFLRTKPGILLMLGGLLMVVGGIFEKNHSIAHNAFYEEILELAGYSSILLSAFAVNCGIARHTS